MKRNSWILVVDDEQAVLDSLAEVLSKEGYQVTVANNGSEALDLMRKKLPDLLITDLRLPQMDGMQILAETKKMAEQLPVIVMTAFTTMETAIAAIKQGAYDYISKPFKLDQLRLVVKRGLEQSRLIKENHRLQVMVDHQQRVDTVIGRSPEMVEMYKLVAKVAPMNTTVLIEGASGTGKEVVAKLIHQTSGCQGPFLAINCGAITETLLESELFGYAKGAFTGAVGSKPGILESAQGGTCFLDEIANTSLNLQMKLLRVLQEGEVMRVGATQTTKINTRIIAASNQPLAQLVKQKQFREDLYFRLKIITIRLPKLEDRQGDIPLLIDYFVAMHAKKQQRQVVVEKNVYTVLSQAAWPGNVRELAHAVERAMILNTSGILTLDDFSEKLKDDHHPSDKSFGTAKPLKTLAEVEKNYIEYVLEQVGGHVSRAAEVLDIDRRTIYRLLKRGHPTTDATRQPSE